MNVGEVFFGGASFDVVDRVGVDVLSIDLAGRGDAGSSADGKPAGTGSDVGYGFAGCEIEKIHDAINVEFLVAIGVLEDGEIAFIGSAGGPLLLLRCLRLCAMRFGLRKKTDE